MKERLKRSSVRDDGGDDVDDVGMGDELEDRWFGRCVKDEAKESLTNNAMSILSCQLLLLLVLQLMLLRFATTFLGRLQTKTTPRVRKMFRWWTCSLHRSLYYSFPLSSWAVLAADPSSVPLVGVVGVGVPAVPSHR